MHLRTDPSNIESENDLGVSVILASDVDILCMPGIFVIARHLTDFDCSWYHWTGSWNFMKDRLYITFHLINATKFVVTSITFRHSPRGATVPVFWHWSCCKNDAPAAASTTHCNSQQHRKIDWNKDNGIGFNKLRCYIFILKAGYTSFSSALYN